MPNSTFGKTHVISGVRISPKLTTMAFASKSKPLARQKCGLFKLRLTPLYAFGKTVRMVVMMFTIEAYSLFLIDGYFFRVDF